MKKPQFKKSEMHRDLPKGIVVSASALGGRYISSEKKKEVILKKWQ